MENILELDLEKYLIGFEILKRQLMNLGNVNVITTGSGSFSNLNIPTTTATVGAIIQNGEIIFHTIVPTQQTPLYKNIFIGEDSGSWILDNTTGSFRGTGNVAVGTRALKHLTTGYYNFAMGTRSLEEVNTGNSNVGLGHQAGANINSGSSNICIGRDAGVLITSGGYSTFIGSGAGQVLTTGYFNVGIGRNTFGSSANNIYRCIAIGNEAGKDEDTNDRLIIDNRDQGSAAATRTNAIIYGVMDADPANQILTINGEILGSYGAKIGDGGTTDYIETSSTGVQTFHGDARYWIGFEIDNSEFKEPPAQSATKVNRGIGTAYEFADGNEEHIHAGMRITGRWDTSEDLQVIFIWDSPTTSANCNWEVRYLFRAADEDMTETNTEGTIDCLEASSSTANGLVHSTCVIPTADFDSGDKILNLEIWRDGDDVTDTLGASAFLHRMIIRGVASKLGGAI